jgi:hypothetical protein
VIILPLIYLLISYAFLFIFVDRTDSIFGYITLSLYSLLCATLSITTLGSITLQTGEVVKIEGMWIIAIFFIFMGLISITKIYRTKNK